MRLLQVCNVGNIVGGTAACAWSVTRALPEFEHVIWFRSKPTAETEQVFAGCRLETGRVLSREAVGRIEPDIILLHNTPASAVYWKTGTCATAVTVQYRHSAGRDLAGADREVSCSRYLQRCVGKQGGGVLIQGVPLPPRSGEHDSRALCESLTVGRMCTPTAKKWNGDLPGFYRELSTRFPEIRWEFVGCPGEMQARLAASVSGRCRFFPANWQARRRLWKWHVLLYSQIDVAESFGRVCAESLRVGCVPVVDEQGGFIEQLAGTGGSLCARKSQFSETLDALRNIGVWWERSEKCRERGNLRFSLQSYRTRLLDVFSGEAGKL